MVVDSFTPISLILIDRYSASWPMIEAEGRFCINVLAEY